MTVSQQKKENIAAAMKKIIENEGELDYRVIAEKLNSRRVKMVKGGTWNMDTARKMAVETGVNYARDKILSRKRKVIVAAVNGVLAKDSKKSIRELAIELNALGVKTLSDCEWNQNNLAAWVNNAPECIKKYEDRQNAANKIKSAGVLRVMVATKELREDVVQGWGNCAARAKQTIENLKAQGV